MAFSTPIRSRPVDDLMTAIELWFSDKYQGDDDNWPSGRFLVRGGICWPDRYDERTDSVQGCAVVAGYNLGSDICYVFDESLFNCIDHIIDLKTRAIRFTGLAPWFNASFAKLLADTYYVNQADDVRDRWEREAHTSPTLTMCPPRFVDCRPWGDVSKGESLIWEWLTRGRVKVFDGNPIDAEFKRYRKGEEKVLTPALHALACCLAGMSGQIEQARDVARSPANLVGKVSNVMMVNNPRDWRGNQ